MDIQTATRIINLSTAALLFFGTRLVDDVFLFFLVGAIPGTSHSVPSWLMLTLCSLAAGWVAYFIARAHGLDRAAATFFQTIKQTLHRPLSQ